MQNYTLHLKKKECVIGLSRISLRRTGRIISLPVCSRHFRALQYHPQESSTGARSGPLPGCSLKVTSGMFEFPYLIDLLPAIGITGAKNAPEVAPLKRKSLVLFLKEILRFLSFIRSFFPAVDR
jgi:hypothetical protein